MKHYLKNIGRDEARHAEKGRDEAIQVKHLRFIRKVNVCHPAQA